MLLYLYKTGTDKVFTISDFWIRLFAFLLIYIMCRQLGWFDYETKKTKPKTDSSPSSIEPLNSNTSAVSSIRGGDENIPLIIKDDIDVFEILRQKTKMAIRNGLNKPYNRTNPTTIAIFVSISLFAFGRIQDRDGMTFELGPIGNLLPVDF